MIIKLLIEGGDMKPGPVIAQQLGPMGINIGKVISEVNNATKEFKGMKVPVEIDVDKKSKEFKVRTFSPPTAELLKKEAKLEKGSAKIKEEKVGNISIEDIIKVAKIKYANMLEKEFKSAVKSVLGTAAAMGLFVESLEPADIVKEIDSGKFEKEINSKSTETSTEKRKSIESFFNNIKSAQELKVAQAKKAAEEAEKKAAETQAKEPVQAAAKPALGKAEAKPAEKKK
ncbi:MAG: 50S ribosomal protein L11 [Nanoarchaeota archaeon]|nr:50S ribosomal protein L11 [Nanoarchaeota archaeon]